MANDYVLEPYDRALEKILNEGVIKSNRRTGKKTLYLCGLNSRYQISEYFPVLTRRRYSPKAVIAELLWFLSGSTNNNDLVKLGANYWTPWVSSSFEEEHGYVPGSFGEVYGFQLRYFGGEYGDGEHNYGLNGFDQLDYLIQTLREDPQDRRILFSLWNPRSLDKQRLPPCHYTFQVCVDDQGRMSGHALMRSADYPIGIPFDIFLYSALTYMLAQQTGFQPYELILETVDSHIYLDQIDGVKEYLKTPVVSSPKLLLNKAPSITEYKVSDFQLVGFTPSPIKIDIPVAV